MRGLRALAPVRGSRFGPELGHFQTGLKERICRLEERSWNIMASVYGTDFPPPSPKGRRAFYLVDHTLGNSGGLWTQLYKLTLMECLPLEPSEALILILFIVSPLCSQTHPVASSPGLR